MPATRIAPTPSGRLHLGNAANFLLTSWWAQELDATLALRLDDVDGPRLRQEYLEDVFDVLAWLGIAWDSGPRSARDAHAARAGRVSLARRRLDEAREAGLPCYACACSRSQAGLPTGGCPGRCRERGLALIAQETALRLSVPIGTDIEVDGGVVHLDQAMGDFVIWRRDDLPAYQWLSVTEDTAAGITHILRGDDLRESSAAQLHLAGLLPDQGFLSTTIVHHPLLTDAEGIKLSKSVGNAQGLARDDATAALVRETAQQLGAPLGILAA